MIENTFALVKNWLHACSSHRATFVAVFSCKVRVDDGSIEIETGEFSRDESLPRERNFRSSLASQFYPRKISSYSSLVPRQKLLLADGRRQVQNERHLGCSLRAKKKKSETKEGEKKERKEEGGVLPLGPMMTKTTSKVFLMDSLRCLCSLCRASNRYQNFLV